MNARRNTDWYEHLVDQSKTDHIYDLIHGCYPLNDWTPNHDYDFVVLRLNDMPATLSQTIPEHHISTDLNRELWCFPGDDYILLNSDFLTDYLEAARRFSIVEDFEGREFIELLFTYNPDDYVDYESEAQAPIPVPDYRTVTPDTLTNIEDAIGIAYELLRTAKERTLAFEYATIAETFLNDKMILISEDANSGLYETVRLMLGYNVVAMVYAWNNKIHEAARADEKYLLYPNVWEALSGHIGSYLEMLIAKRQANYLEFIFRDKDFRKEFLPHYEAYISMLVNDLYEITRMHDVVGIINRVNNVYSAYL